jgi:Subtilase family/Concanavalin A-like lectin/glucanases superfamily/Domain of unknown function (DUF5011)/Secretion system C-terminal sorting domain/CUB domain
MKKVLLSIAFLFLAQTLFSQKGNQDDYSISINGNSIATSNNFKQQAQQFRKSTSKQNLKNQYTLMQFTKTPTIQEQQKLKEQGATLINSLSKNVYYALVKPDFYNRTSFSKNIRTVITVAPEYKLDPIVAKGIIPDYASEGNAIKVVVSYFKGMDAKTIATDLNKLNIKESKIFDSFNEVHLKLPKSQLLEMAKLNWVQNIELIATPVVSENKPGVSSHKVNILNSTIAGLGYGLTGKGVKIGIWDSNVEKHKDHTGRVVNKEYEDSDSHGEHVFGTVGGAGLLDPKAKGMAPEVKAYTWNFNIQSNNLPVYVERANSATEDGIELTQNSYGRRLTTPGFNTFRYESSDRGDDNVTVQFPYLLNVYSNGNDQSNNPGGFNTSSKSSKNALHVAANDPNDVISNYSSFGPTIDGRLVPQIAAVGTDVYSLDYNNSYQFLSGTSMATPGVSGTLALLYERYKNIYGGTKPIASLMKALVSNTAKDVGNLGPDYKYGFGNINGLRAVKTLDNVMFYTSAVANGVTYEKDIIVPSGLTKLKVMLAYTDVPATPGATNILVNNLDIKIVKNGTETLPWILNPTLPNANAIRGVDNLNNIEQVTIDNPDAGSYKIVVTGTNIPLNTQEFAVVYDYVAPELTLTYPIGGEKMDTADEEYIRWDYEGEPKTFTLEYSLDGGENYTVIANNIPSSARNFLWTVPASIGSNTKIRISAGTKVSASKESFTIMTEPKNLAIDSAVCGVNSFLMDWDAIPGAKYEVLKMNGYQFDVVATVTDPSYTFTGITAGEDNWFSVRAIDIASNAVSERVRAVNVEPITSPVLTTVSLPLKENFNERKAVNHTLSKAGTNGTIGYEFIDIDLLDGVKIAGTGTVASTTWVASTTTDAFTKNPTYKKTLSFCNIDATSLTGKNIRVKFNLIWSSVTANKNFFRTLVNGTALNSNENISVYGGATLNGETIVTYDLSTFAGTTFSLNLEAINDIATDLVQIDNVEIYEATATDLALSSLIPSSGTFTASETVSVKVYNYSPVAISNIPVSYKINDGAEVVEAIAGPINPLSEITYDFVQKADYSVPGVYKVLSAVNYVGDAVTSNNSVTETIINSGTDIIIGSAPTVTTCTAVFTDSGTRFTNYSNNLTQTMTFVPATAGSSIKVDFTSFALELDFDYLYIYNGVGINAPLLGIYTGNTLPASVTSSAAGGELTFRFTSDAEVIDSGWVAEISCATKPVTSDASIVSIESPEVLGKKTSTNKIAIVVENLSNVALTDVPVFYQVDGGAKVTEIIPTIDAFTKADYVFTTTTDLSTLDATYVIKSGIDQVDDNVANNVIEKTVYNKNSLPVHTNTNGFAISKLKWDNVINISETTPYSDFTSTKIPVYAGFTYQPQVTIVKPERPITSDLTGTPGVFTLMVIDLNGDGNLTDEFYAGTFWVNTLNTGINPIIPSTTSIHNFRNNIDFSGGVTIPAGTTSGEKLMRVIHMFRSPNEFYNVVLGPTLDGLTNSRGDFEVEEYTINVLPFSAADTSVDRITAPLKPGLKAVVVSAVVRNYSTSPISNFDIAYKINGGTEVVETVTATIGVGSTANFTFATKADLSLPSEYSIEVYTKLVGDTDALNDGKTITLSHATPYATNVSGTFDGINDYATTDIVPALSLTNNYTYEAWINQKEPSVFGRIFDKNRITFFVHNNNNPIYNQNSLVLSINSVYNMNTGANTIQKGKWHHVAFTVDSANLYTIYIDGLVVPYTVTSGTPVAALANGTNPVFMGNNAGLARGFNGNIDEVRVWSGVKDQTTIASNSMTKYVGNEAGLLAYYSFEEGDKSFVFDKSASDNTAKIVNADTNGIGNGKFWNAPVLLKDLQFVNQLASSYDADAKKYTVLLNTGADITTAVANYTLQMNSIAKINGATQLSGTTPNDYTTPVTLTVEGVGFNAGIVETYTVEVLTGLSNESKLLYYNFDPADNAQLTQVINTIITGSNASSTVAYGTNVSGLKASFSVSPGAQLYIDATKQINQKTTELDYNNDVIVTVVSEDKLSQSNYAVSLNAKNTVADFINYTVTNQVGASTIDATSSKVGVLVNNNATLSALKPSFQVSEQATARIGTYLQNSGVTTLNYSTPVVYKLMAQNGSIENWMVTIERAKPTITLLGDATVTLPKGCTYLEAGYEAIDNLNNDITTAVSTTGTVDENTLGQYLLIYTAKDALNNESTVTRTVNVTNDNCTTLSLNENDINGFSVFPIPATQGKIVILAGGKGLKNIQVFDIVGKKILSQQISGNELNINTLKDGVYILKAEQDGKTATKKLIVETR